jgi:hypothetical protein
MYVSVSVLQADADPVNPPQLHFCGCEDVGFFVAGYAHKNAVADFLVFKGKLSTIY